MVLPGITPGADRGPRLGLAVGYLYLPRVNEYQGRQSAIETDLRARVLRVFEGAGVPWDDAMEGMEPGRRFFFPADRHLTPEGHQQFANGLVRVLRRMGIPPPG